MMTMETADNQTPIKQKPSSIPDGTTIISYLNDPENTEQSKDDLLHRLASRLKRDGQKEAAILVEDHGLLSLLDDLSLDLPSIILHRVCRPTKTEPRSMRESDSEDETISDARICLTGLVEYGSPKEVFMAVTTTILQLLTKTSNSSLDELDHRQSSPEDPSLPGTNIMDQGLIEWTFLSFVLSPLSTVLLKILQKSRNPSGFFDPFCQSILGLLDRCGGSRSGRREEGVFERRMKIYQEIADVCHKAADLHGDLEQKTHLLLAASVSLIFACPSTQLPLGKAFLCHRDPKWRSSFSRLLQAEESVPKTNSFGRLFFSDLHTDPVRKIQEAVVAPLLANIEARQIKQKIVQIGARFATSLEDDSLVKSLAGLGYGELSGQQLVRVAQQGALVIEAFDRFSKIGKQETGDQPLPMNMEAVEALITPTFVEAPLFLIMSERPGEGRVNEELGSKLLSLASTDPTGSSRLLLMRSLACLVEGLERPLARLEFIGALIDQHPSQPNIKSALVSLLRESLALLSSIPSGPDMDRVLQLLRQLLLTIINSTPLDLELVKQALDAGQLENWSSIDELLKFMIERLNLVYLLLKIDHTNATGIKKGPMNMQVKELLITPIYGWIEATMRATDLTIVQNRGLGSLVYSLKISLDLCIEVLNRL
ncbi:hypothetical protein PGTUg99_023764 [Puccinia graminis f. sp. tritici]|uniref:Uncharacterized protein n=2 Tax=Puccinia graminis f. sp. tritici TaxID=56615 RepID=A0A5B0RFT7_PUCGR|nr:hypothetical protein PGTUg99_023764 [Puccinia graminis f. sp. tritici]